MLSHSYTRKTLPLMAAIGLLLAACGGGGDDDTGTSAPAGAQAGGSLEAVCEAAAQEDGEAVWYESSLPEQTDQILQSFGQTYSDVDVVHQRITGGAGIGGLVTQELQAGARTADLVTASNDIVAELAGRGHLLEMEPEDLGITDEELMPEPYAVHTTSTVPVLIYNTNLVNESDLEGSWEDLTDAQWAGKVTVWNRGGIVLSGLVAEWGEEQTREYVEELAASNPKLNESTFAIAQEVGAGTSPIGLSFFHTTKEVQDSGAPLETIVLDPVPVSELYSGVVAESPNTASAQCFLGWLVSEEGALAYEDATFRGNHRIEATDTAALLEGRTTSIIEFSEVARAAELIAEYNEVLAQ